MPKRAGANAGPETREAVLVAARRLFTERGYDATSMRDVAAAVGLTNAALYYHFAGKESLLAALSEQRRDEIDALVRWVGEQEPGPGLLRETALRRVDAASQEQLDGLRFALANRPALQRATAPEQAVRPGIDALVEVLAAGADPTRRVVVRLALEAVSCAGLAAGADADLETVREAARIMVLALT